MLRIVFAVAALGSTAGAEPAERLPLRRVAMVFAANGEVLSAPTMMVGGTQCQRFVTGPTPAIAVEYCATGDQLQITWTVRRDQKMHARRVTGSFADGASFDASIPNLLAVSVEVGATEGYLEN
jgi:hypothetical protein